MRSLEVSEETYKRLQELARPFEDSPEDVILRLLGCDGNGKGPEIAERVAANHPQRTLTGPLSVGRALVSQGGRIPHGTKLRSIYKGKEYKAEVRDGSVLWNGKRYTSLSAAAVAVIQSTGTDRPTEDGWRFWEFWDEEEKDWLSKADPRDRRW